MPRPTLTSIADKLEVIHKDIADLKKGKVDKSTNELVLQRIGEKVDDVQKDVNNITSYGKWLVLTIGGIVVAVIMRLILK